MKNGSSHGSIYFGSSLTSKYKQIDLRTKWSTHIQIDNKTRWQGISKNCKLEVGGTKWAIHSHCVLLMRAVWKVSSRAIWKIGARMAGSFSGQPSHIHLFRRKPWGDDRVGHENVEPQHMHWRACKANLKLAAKIGSTFAPSSYRCVHAAHC